MSAAPTSPPPALDLADALARVLADAAPLPAEDAPIREALGAVLAAPLHARWRLPLADTSMMDGWALRASSLRAGARTRLRAHDESAAGHPARAPVGDGEATRIATGALLPPGADAVVAQEDVDRDPDAPGEIVVDGQRSGPVRPGHFVRAAGSEVAEGSLLLDAGARLGPGELALLASAGHPSAPIHRRPRVAILCTGDELRPIGATPAPGEVISTNGMMLAALCRELGVPADERPPVADSLGATVDALRGALASADVLLTSGGISVGDHDHVAAALATLGLQPRFTRLNLRPGRPLTFGRLGEAWVFALPGNPASTYVTFEMLVRPLLARLLGLPDGWRRPRRRVTLAAPAPGAGGRAHIVRARVDGDEARPLGQQRSGSLRSLAGHNALLVIPPGTRELPVGAEVEAILVDA
ncbi:MAG: molybdopterin molybdotransferase MoeA [Myxococcales bacterium]|nr:molybdopterin molybdotransferase MoeA [Myxococcales bacterium]